MRFLRKPRKSIFFFPKNGEWRVRERERESDAKERERERVTRKRERERERGFARRSVVRQFNDRRGSEWR